MKLFELKIEDDTDEIFAISLVESPAIQSDFVYFNEHKKEVVEFAKVEERKLVGPILIPDKRIKRLDENDNSEYEVFFSKATVAKLAQNYLKKKYVDKATIEHTAKKIKGISLVESWIKESKINDKSNLYGLNAPLGSWLGVFQVDKTPDGDAIWYDYIKTGKVKGFSVEALLSHKLIKASNSYMLKDIKDLTEEQAKEILQTIHAMLMPDVELAESYQDYPQSATNNAKRALDWADKNGWGSCLEATGKQRANQLGNREGISRDTIARMASFKRHQQYKDVPYTEGCGGLAWDAWGGTSGVEWAINKLKEIDGQ